MGEQKRKLRMGRAIGLLVGSLVMCWASAGTKVQAGTLYDSPYVTLSPDGRAWTFQEELKAPLHYKKGETVKTGILSSLRKLRTGEHYYGAERHGEVPVGSWQVMFPYAVCRHALSQYPGEYHGLSFGRKICLQSYYSGWAAFCADCGQDITGGLIYGSREAVSSVCSIDVDLDKYYLCPTCSHLEQGFGGGSHICRKISHNRYQVRYDSNVSSAPLAEGRMEPSFHMYDNATVYEGREVTPNTRLSRNSYYREGYRFVEWNTSPDGSGSSYTDGAEIFNLSDANYDEEAGTGSITLYARWEKVKTGLEIDPNGGSYLGTGEKTSLCREYGEEYLLETETVVPPQGYQVSFVTNGGEELEAVECPWFFDEWSLGQPAGGQLQEDGRYVFRGEDGDTDYITALYVRQPIVLPEPQKEGHSFGGWYRDEACTLPVGHEGEEFLPDGDVTLYAKWAELVLYAGDNYMANGGRGAVDLSWYQKDGKNKAYKLYQSVDGVRFVQLYDAAAAAEPGLSYSAYGCSEGVRTVTIPDTGFYELTAAGAQGENSAMGVGGKGGSVTGKFYLVKGEVLTIFVGGQKGYNGGGVGGSGGGGGGYTLIASDKKGTLLIGGGGGGASAAGDGGDGGDESGVLEQEPSRLGRAGESGGAGGGGGYRGGRTGEIIYHRHYSGCRYHTHSAYGGSCYTRCNGTKTEHEEIRSWEDSMCCSNCQEGPYAHYPGNPYGACGSFNSHWERTTSYYSCDLCGAVSDSSAPCSEYRFSCSLNAGYNCGKTEGVTIESVRPAYGGSSYVNTEYAITYQMEKGSRRGDGEAVIRALEVGFRDGQQLNAVLTPDRAAPEAVDGETVKVRMEKAAAQAGETHAERTEDVLAVTFDRPTDRGSAYFHRAESYTAGTGELLCTSNITRNVLISGIRGYYYLTDAEPDTQVNAENAENRGALLEQERIVIPAAAEERYLHIAVADVAGNLSPTTHICLRPEEIAGRVSTTKLQAESVVGGKDWGSVCPAEEENVWYVRADGTTPFLLTYGSRLHGEAREGYQVDYQLLEAETEKDGRTQRCATELPHTVPVSSTEALDASAFVQRTEGSALLGDGMYMGAVRTDDATKLCFYRAFTLSSGLHGERIRVTPRAGASYGQGMICSDEQEDSLNALTLLADGKGPEITRLESLESGLPRERSGWELSLIVTASDDLSGVRELSLKILNEDTQDERSYRAAEEGRLQVDITPEDPVFRGDFTISVTASDRVGNVSEKVYRMRELEVETRIERILEPHTPVFKLGESGILYITTYGYAERVEVEFPEAMNGRNREQDRTIVYELPQYSREEQLQFMVPLYLLEGTELTEEGYTVTVRACKGDRQCEKQVSFRIAEGGASVLEEFRTRLR